MSEKPRLSVIIASYNSKRTINDCIQSLEKQTADKDFEIIVIDSSTDDTAAIVKERFPQVNVYQSKERKYPESARNIGISVAKGEIIAFIDADCVADKHWIREILKAHQSPQPVIGGAIANGNPGYVGWAAYFCELVQWMPCARTKWLTDVATGNTSYKREVFEKYGGYMEGTYSADTAFHWRLRQNGVRLYFEPSILVYHCYIDNFIKFLSHEYFHGRSFAGVRVEVKNFSRLKRGIYMLLSPFIVVKLFLRTGISNLKNRRYLLHYLKVTPLLTLGIIFWTAGECVGYARSRNKVNEDVKHACSLDGRG